MKPLLIVRPEPGCVETVAAARALGLEAHGAPLFAIGPVDWTLPEGAFDALLAGSANAFRHGGAGLAKLRALPVHAVGKATAEAARQAGFAVSTIGEGGLQNVLDQLDPPLRLLRLAGAERVALTPPAGIALTECVVYAAVPLSLTNRPDGPTVVALHSAAAAQHFAAECDRLSLDRHLLSLACIGPRVAAAAGESWAEVRAASVPTDAALLALAAEMCQTVAQQD